jgi:hypothetical protein
MRIVEGSLTLVSQHQRTQVTAVDERLRQWVGAEPSRRSEKVSLSEAARALLEKGAAAAEKVKAASQATAAKVQGQASGSRASSGEEDLDLGSRERLNRLILERTFHVRLPGHHGGSRGAQASEVAQAAASPQSAAAAPRAGFGVEYDRVAVHVDQESLKVQAAGQVVTADGRQLDISYALAQSRQVVSQSEVHVRMGDAKQVDPLALDLDGGGVTLTGEKMAFDLNSDGKPEQVSRLSAGDAWLAMDRNGNGQVDDGSELFGPTTGSGFGELRALDADGNGFLDEGDAAFSSLRLWMPGQDGSTGSMTTLLDAGVGAIGLVSVASAFQLQGGTTRETGVYLREAGGAGAVQHVDLDV